MSTLVLILLSTIGISLISLAGLLFLAYKVKPSESTTTLLVSFAAGVLLATAITSVLPEAFEELAVPDVLHWLLAGIVGAFFLERCLLWYHHHHHETHDINPTTALVIFGDGVHNFIDGLAIAASFLVNPALGAATTIAIAAHEIPQEIADYSILRHTGLSRKAALLWNFLSALTAVAGGLVGYFVFQESSHFIPIALAITAGIFLYVAVADLIPELHNAHTPKSILPQSILFIFGVILILVMNSQFGHSHAESGEHEDDHINNEIRRDEHETEHPNPDDHNDDHEEGILEE